MSPSPDAVATPASKSEIRARFQRLSAEWKDQARYLSNSAQIAMLKPYQRIIGMGMPVVPLILEELRREPDQWFWALESITEQDPVPREAAGKVRQMAQAWLEWGKQQGYIVDVPNRSEDIEHDRPDDVAGGVYGEVVQFMRRRVAE
jgi:hypothetical protein